MKSLLPSSFIALLLTGCANLSPCATCKPELYTGEVVSGWRMGVKRGKGIVIKKEF